MTQRKLLLMIITNVKVADCKTFEWGGPAKKVTNAECFSCCLFSACVSARTLIQNLLYSSVISLITIIDGEKSLPSHEQRAND